MADYPGNPDLNRLVRELNDDAESASLSERRSHVRQGDFIEAALRRLVEAGGSDLLLLTGSPPVLRVNGRLITSELAEIEEPQIRNMLIAYTGPRGSGAVDENGSVDFSLRLDNLSGGRRTSWRFRVNIHRQRGQLAASIRALPSEIPTLEQLHLPPNLIELTRPTRGLVLICGPTGSGKTSTIAALIGAINRAQSRHIVTIEDPIEYEHRNHKAIIEQVEIGRDSPSFPAALRAALRQDPDVILVGELRDLETMATAITAAETGHLIFATLHTSDAAQAIHRIIDVFPPAQQEHIRQQLALSLHAIVCQQLIPMADGSGRIPAIELLLANQPVRQHIRSDRLQNLSTELTLGKRGGMITLEESLALLVRNGVITADEAQIRMRHPEDLKSFL